MYTNIMQSFLSSHTDVAILRDSFVNAKPFRFLVIDNFLPPSQFEAAAKAFPSPDAPMWLEYRSGTENKKLQSQNFDSIDAPLANVLAYLNEPEFTKWLEQITDIENIIPDPEYHGGGLHQTLKGGHLAMHVDYNRHSTQGWHRRLNAILYFNETWNASWGGCLEFWTNGVKERAHVIPPVGNRLVVFETTESSWHGHPDPLTPPPGVTRKSIAAYYYTTERPENEIAASHNTVFQARPGEKFSLTTRDLLSKVKRLVKK